MQRNVVHINYATFSVCRMYVCNNIWIYEYNYRIILYICDHVCVCMNIQYIIVHCGSLLWTCHVTGVPARKSRPVACSSDIPTRILRSCWIPKPSYCKSWGVPSHHGCFNNKSWSSMIWVIHFVPTNLAHPHLLTWSDLEVPDEHFWKCEPTVSTCKQLGID